MSLLLIHIFNRKFESHIYQMLSVTIKMLTQEKHSRSNCQICVAGNLGKSRLTQSTYVGIFLCFVIVLLHGPYIYGLN